MKNIKNGKIALIMIMAVSLLTVLVLITFSKTASQKSISKIAIIAAIIILISSLRFVFERYSELKKGYPLFDELEKEVFNKSLIIAYITSIWWLLAIGWMSSLEIIIFRDPSQATGMGIIGMVMILGVSYLNQSRKGVLK